MPAARPRARGPGTAASKFRAAEPGGWQTVAPSAVPHKDGEAAPLALDAAGLARIRDAFVDSAKRAERLGIDALELHGAHGYLLHQFLSPISNKRTDEYGGTLEKRRRFPLEVFDAVRAVFPEATSRSACACPRPTGSTAAGICRRPSNLRRP